MNINIFGNKNSNPLEKNICIIETKGVQETEVKFLNREEQRNLNKQSGVKVINIEEDVQKDYNSFDKIMKNYLPSLEADSLESVPEAIQDEDIKEYTKKLIIAYSLNEYFKKMNETFFVKNLGIKKEFFLNIINSKLISQDKYALIEVFKEINEDIASLKKKLVLVITKIGLYLTIGFSIIYAFKTSLLPLVLNSTGLKPEVFSTMDNIIKMNTYIPLFLLGIGIGLAIFFGTTTWGFLFPESFILTLKNFYKNGFAIVKNFNSLKLISYYLIGISEIPRDKLSDYFKKEFKFLNINENGGIMFNNIFQVVGDIRKDNKFKDWFDSSVLIGLTAAQLRGFHEQKDLLLKQKRGLKVKLEASINSVFTKLDIGAMAVLISSILVSIISYSMLIGTITELMKKL